MTDRLTEIAEQITPSHYKQGEVECIDAIASATANLKGIEAFCTGNAIKYLWRWKQKGGNVDLEKCKWYIEHMILAGTDDGLPANTQEPNDGH